MFMTLAPIVEDLMLGKMDKDFQNKETGDIMGTVSQTLTVVIEDER